MEELGLGLWWTCTLTMTSHSNLQVLRFESGQILSTEKLRSCPENSGFLKRGQDAFNWPGIFVAVLKIQFLQVPGGAICPSTWDVNSCHCMALKARLSSLTEEDHAILRGTRDRGNHQVLLLSTGEETKDQRG